MGGEPAADAAAEAPAAAKRVRRDDRRADAQHSRWPSRVRAAQGVAALAYDWEVESIVRYRTFYRKEQCLVKWKGYGEGRNTWEPPDHLLTDAATAEAATVKEAFLARRRRRRAARRKAERERAGGGAARATLSAQA